MNTAEREPTQDQLTAMAYADGELDAEAARAFEERMRTTPELGREVSQLKRLELLARHVSPPEPIDHEWERLARDPVQRAGWGLGWLLFCAGAVGGTLWVSWALFSSTLETLPKVCLGALWVGFLVLLGTTLRGRLRTLPYDPYTQVKR